MSGWSYRALLVYVCVHLLRAQPAAIGREVAIPRHLLDGEEF